MPFTLTVSNENGTYVHWLAAVVLVVICLWFAPEIRRALGMKEGLDVSPYGYNNMAPAVALQTHSQPSLKAGFLGYPQPPVFNGNTDWAMTNAVLASTVADRANDDATGEVWRYREGVDKPSKVGFTDKGLTDKDLGLSLVGA